MVDLQTAARQSELRLNQLSRKVILYAGKAL